jgi:hypothetical protein
MEVFKYYFMAAGVVATVGIVILFGMCAFEFIKDKAYELKRRHQYKHRFDKPPTAKCHCIDCQYHDNKTGRCFRFHEDSNRLTGDSCFCYEAEPRKKMSEQ